MDSKHKIQIVNIKNLEKIEKFLNDSAYREVIENSENYNTRLCLQRRLRIPRLRLQMPNALWLKKSRQRMPGLRYNYFLFYFLNNKNINYFFLKFLEKAKCILIQHKDGGNQDVSIYLNKIIIHLE